MHKEISNNQTIELTLNEHATLTGKLINNIEDFIDIDNYYKYSQDKELINKFEKKYPAPEFLEEILIEQLKLNLKQMSEQYNSVKVNQIKIYEELLSTMEIIVNDSEEDKTQLSMSHDLLQKRLKGFPSDKQLQPLYFKLNKIKSEIQEILKRN